MTMTVEQAKRTLADRLREQGISASTGIGAAPSGDACITVYLKPADREHAVAIPDEWNGFPVSKRLRGVGVPLAGSLTTTGKFAAL